MAVMYEPIGELWLGRVPWDSSYRHVWHQGMIDKSLIISQFCTLHLTGFSWVPKTNVIKVPDNANNYIGYNYCVYKNNGKLFCAFITEVEYLANQTTGLHLQEDVWHTWGENLVVKRCMVARQHVLSDNLGQWRAAEPSISLESVTLSNSLLSDSGRDLIVIGTNAIPHLKSGVSGNIFQAHSESDFDGSDAVSGGMYKGVYSGVRYYGFSLEGVAQASNFLDNLNKCGAAESVCALFMLSSMFFSLNANHEVSVRQNGVAGSATAPQNHGGGYVPRNKKCLTYPFAYATITDLNGGALTVKYEDCNTWGAVKFVKEAALDPTSPTMLHLVDYQGNATEYNTYMPIDQAPQCSWTYQAYQNWLAQNAGLENQKQNMNWMQILGGLAMTGVGAALMASGVGAPAGGVLGEMGLTTVGAAGLGAAIGGAKAALGGAMAESARAESIAYQQKQPDQVRGTASANTMQALAVNRGAVSHVGLQEQSARRLDQFFDVFGYQIDMVRVPDLTGRPSWNYVKTVGAQMGGAIPADRLAAMNRSFDNGITFWHNADVGNYALNNDLS